ncbi:hypothetical protein EDC65_1672 [Stella humosa]|uniref:Uncharacterized protein n=1 Tax=Stella humosa TaxID=94 RepID=A0A3N1M2D3_9PROT|nr:hypothetical protein [Stella humosa]ROP99881.1 hypothetical protein EDC65_1672 [Stella humosa]BBK30889.1 hypothetical protein STHU_15230 [Stella humosa]
MPSALEIILVVLVVAVFFAMPRLSGRMRDIGRAAGGFGRTARATAGAMGEDLPRLPAPPRPPAVG